MKKASNNLIQTKLSFNERDTKKTSLVIVKPSKNNGFENFFFDNSKSISFFNPKLINECCFIKGKVINIVSKADSCLQSFTLIIKTERNQEKNDLNCIYYSNNMPQNLKNENQIMVVGKSRKNFVLSGCGTSQPCIHVFHILDFQA